MNCKKCNALLPEGSTKCPECGAEYGKKNPVTLLVVMVAVGFVVGILLTVLIMSLSGKSDPATPTTPAITVPSTTAPAPTNPLVVEIGKSYTAADDVVIANANEVVAAAGEYQLTVSELQMYYWNTVYEFLDQNAMYLSYYGFDYTKPFDEQVYDPATGITWEQYFLDAAIVSWHRYVIMNDMAQKADFQLSTELQDYFTALPESMQKWAEQYEYSSVDELVAADFGASATFASYESYLRRYYTSYEFFGSEFDSMELTDAEIEAYYTANEEALKSEGYSKDDGNTVDVRHVLIQPEGGTKNADGSTTYSDAEWEAARVKAQSLLDAWLEGEATEDAFAQMAKANSSDGNAADGGIYKNITSETNFVPEFLNWCMDANRKVGDSGLVKTTYGYHIMYFSASQPIWYVACDENLRAETMNKRVDEAAKAFELEVFDEKIVLAFVDLGATE